jgi:glycosyltransferase involved in cell wall biosynthesis
MLTQLAEVDLRQPLQPIYVDERYSQLSVLARWGYCPLGEVHFCRQPAMPVVTAAELTEEVARSTAWTLWERAIVGDLERLDRGNDRPLPPVTVIVCTRDRLLLLHRCLTSLVRLDYPEYEVVVVDNASRDPGVADVVAKNGCRYVREDGPGLNWARNRGIREASHDLIAFIDDDAQAAPGWLRGIAFGFEDPQIMAVTGLVLPAELQSAAQHNFEKYGGMSKGFTAKTFYRANLSHRALLWASHWGVGTNMAFRRILFEAIGGFDPALDVGTPTGGGGDLEFFHRTIAEGYALRYEPTATVYHLHRRDYASLRRQIYNNGRDFGAYLLTVARNYPHRRRSVLWCTLRWWLWDTLLRRLLKSLVRRKRSMFRLALAELQGACCAVNAYQRSRKLALQFRAEGYHLQRSVPGESPHQ